MTTNWTPVIEKAEAEARELGLKNFRVEKIRIQKMDKGMPTVWYRIATKGRPEWRANERATQ